MEPFEVFRAYLVRRVALQLGIPIESRTVWEIWVALLEEFPEAAYIASDQWLKRDLLVEHLHYADCVHNLNKTETSVIQQAHESPEFARYIDKWQQFNLRIQAAAAKRRKVDAFS
jgi:hypothetical protein